MASIEDRVRDLVVEQLGVSEDQVNSQASFIDDLGSICMESGAVAFTLLATSIC